MKSLIILSLAISNAITVLAQNDKTTSSGSGIVYENHVDILPAPDCNPSEVYLKKKVKAEMAKFYKDYFAIAVDFSSFKGQKGYTDKQNASRIVYPYKIEFFVFVKRKVVKDGKELTEYSTWEHDSEYEYATKPKRKCEFKRVSSTKAKLVSKEVY